MMNQPAISVNPEMLRLARDARELTQIELSKRLNIAQGTISKVEAGILPFPTEYISALCRELDLPASFFRQAGHYEAGPPILYRRLQSLGALFLHRKAAQMALIKGHLLRLLDSCEPPEYKLPSLMADSMRGGPKAIGRRVRELWRIPPGPVSNLIRLIEKAGIVIIQFDFGTAKIDGCADWINQQPVIFVNRNLCPSRLRFTLAHELGHLVMHNSYSDHADDEANEFAAELLIPEMELKPMLLPLTLSNLGQLKLHWKVSMQALLMQAGRFGLSSEYSRRKLWMTISARGYRTAEPFEDKLPLEQPKLLRDLIYLHRHDLKFTDEELAKKLNMQAAEFQSLYLEGEKIVEFPR